MINDTILNIILKYYNQNTKIIIIQIDNLVNIKFYDKHVHKKSFYF